MTAAQAAFCGKQDLSHFAAVKRMSNKRHGSATPRIRLRRANPRPHAFEPEERLEGWKHIAAYLKRDVRTIQRWERAEGFPVRRQMHRKLGSVLAYKDELDRWVEQRCSLQNKKPAATSLPVYELYLKGRHSFTSSAGRISNGREKCLPARSNWILRSNPTISGGCKSSAG